MEVITEEDEQELLKNISSYSNIEWIRNTYYMYRTLYDKNIGLVFIDGKHTEDQCYQDFASVVPHVNPQTLIAFHDNGNFKEVTATIQFLLATNQLKEVQTVKSIFVGTYIGKPISND